MYEQIFFFFKAKIYNLDAVLPNLIEKKRQLSLTVVSCQTLAIDSYYVVEKRHFKHMITNKRYLNK